MGAVLGEQQCASDHDCSTGGRNWLLLDMLKVEPMRSPDALTGRLSQKSQGCLQDFFQSSKRRCRRLWVERVLRVRGCGEEPVFGACGGSVWEDEKV